MIHTDIELAAAGNGDAGHACDTKAGVIVWNPAAGGLAAVRRPRPDTAEFTARPGAGSGTS